MVLVRSFYSMDFILCGLFYTNVSYLLIPYFVIIESAEKMRENENFVKNHV